MSDEVFDKAFHMAEKLLEDKQKIYYNIINEIGHVFCSIEVCDQCDYEYLMFVEGVRDGTIT